MWHRQIQNWSAGDVPHEAQSLSRLSKNTETTLAAVTLLVPDVAS